MEAKFGQLWFLVLVTNDSITGSLLPLFCVAITFRVNILLALKLFCLFHRIFLGASSHGHSLPALIILGRHGRGWNLLVIKQPLPLYPVPLFRAC